MGGTKIMVVQLKQLIRTGIFALIGIILIIALIVLILPNKPKTEAGLYAPGTYTAQIILHSKPVNVSVTVTENEIVDIMLNDLEETQAAFYPLFKPTMDTLSESIIKKQTTNVSVTPEAEYTSAILLDAINSALTKAIVTEKAE